MWTLIIIILFWICATIYVHFTSLSGVQRISEFAIIILVIFGITHYFGEHDSKY